MVGTRSRAIRHISPTVVFRYSASDGRCTPARPDLHVSTRLSLFLPARSRVPIVFGPFHYCASCERAPPDAPETIDDQTRCTGCRYRTINGGSRGSASLPFYVRLRIARERLPTILGPTPHAPFRRTFFSSPPPALASPKFARPSPVPASDNSKHLRHAL